MEFPLYLTLYSPAIDWILQCIAYRAPEVSVVRKRWGEGLILPVKNPSVSTYLSVEIIIKSLDPPACFSSLQEEHSFLQSSR